MHLNQNTIRNIVGILGNIISCGLFLSPMPTFIQIIKNKDVQQFSPVPYLSMLLNCMLWFLYALPFIHPNSLLILTINAIGLVFESTYLFIFFIYAKREGRLKVLKILAVEIVFMTVVVVLVLLLTHTTTKRSFIVGILCIIFGTCMYASPLVVMKLVIQTKSVEYMPFTLSLVSFINAVFWTTYGLLPFDINVLIPNGLGVILAFAQLVLYACYYRSTPKREDNAAEIELSVTV